ncbi:MAG: hypothetical protein II951_12980 [Bacteroidales bacterium]|nr:hypothetical protein [Bacteroidales bacterium]
MGREIDEEFIRQMELEDFFMDGKPLYRDQLGWGAEYKRGARTSVSKELFDEFVCERRYNLVFYYVDNDTFYGIHSEQSPTPVKILSRDRRVPYIDGQCEWDTHEEGEILYLFENIYDIWDKVRIDGVSLERVLSRSYMSFDAM